MESIFVLVAVEVSDEGKLIEVAELPNEGLERIIHWWG